MFFQMYLLRTAGMERDKSHMNGCLKLCFALIFSTVFLAHAEAGKTTDFETELTQLLDKINAANKQLESVKADINYQRDIPLLGESEKSSGKFYFVPPDKISMALDKPRNEEIYSDGEKWWLVDHSANQVEIYTVDAEGRMAESAFLTLGYGSGCEDLREKYDLKLLDKTRETKENNDVKTHTEWHVRLTPKDKEKSARFDQMEFEVSDDLFLPHKVILYESDGEIIQSYSLNNIRLNEKIDDKRFIGDIPRGYTTISQ